MKDFIRRLLPPALYDAVRWCLQTEARKPQREPIRFCGNYASWDAARHDSTGYDSPAILGQTRAALLKVKNGEAAFERDSVLLPAPELPLPLLAGLLRAATENGGRLRVLDFGGSLGSSYFQCRDYLSSLSGLQWNVVEQPTYVACGQKEFSDDRLHFFGDVVSALQAEHPDVLLLSSVLQYLPAPADFVRSMLVHPIKYIIVDRTFFHSGPGHRLTVQRVPQWIYPASYPAWFFSESDFCMLFSTGYELIAAFPALDQPVLSDASAYAKGMIYRRRP